MLVTCLRECAASLRSGQPSGGAFAWVRRGGPGGSEVSARRQQRAIRRPRSGRWRRPGRDHAAAGDQGRSRLWNRVSL